MDMHYREGRCCCQNKITVRNHKLHIISSNRSTYAHNILLGLVFSCIGDGLLNHDYFAPGMAAFGIAQIFYIIAFQTQLLKLWIAGFLYAGGIASMYIRRTEYPFRWPRSTVVNCKYTFTNN